MRSEPFRPIGIALGPSQSRLTPADSGETRRHGISKRVDVLATFLGPCCRTACNRNALVDENASNAVSNACDSIVDRLSVFDKKSELSMLFARNVDSFEFIQDIQSSELKSVVAIGLSLDVGPFPCIFIGRANERLKSQLFAKSADPPARPTRFHDDDVNVLEFEDFGKYSR